MRVVPLGREEESAAIYRLLKDAIEEKEHGVLYVSGMPGCGKTLTCTRVLQAIKEKYTDVLAININCGNLVLPSGVFLEIHRGINPEAGHSSPRILEEVLKREKYVVVLVDEIDMLISKNQNILYGLLELPFLSKNLYLLAISNTYNLPDKRLTPKVRSRLGWNRINFPIYKKSQVISILQENHTDLAFTPEALEYCANKICTLNGDIRKAFQIQKQAVDHSQKNKSSSVSLEEVDNAIKYVFHSMHGLFIRSLSEYQKILLNLAAQKGPLLPDALYQDFRAFLSLKSYPPIAFKEFHALVKKLNEFGVLKGRSNTLMIETDYIPEELDIIFQGDQENDIDIINSV
ncbi:cell division control protein 6 [Nematocida sp. AWRm77]|nr:cell division control protein 6 [Nematocida sp. AWRm77]